MRPISLYEFGSSEAVVRQTQRRFVEFFRGSGPVLDIGCGRGVFLELLREAGIEAVGMDIAAEAVAACQQKGFNVHQGHAHNYLRDCAGGFGGIFCSHVIEHMGYDDALTFLMLCHRALRPGGILVLVTPNPEDISVISEIFWLDPTHVRPYPKLLLESMLVSHGFSVRHTLQFLGSWRMIARRRWPAYYLRRLLLGKHFGKPNTLVLAEKQVTSPPARLEKDSCQSR